MNIKKEISLNLNTQFTKRVHFCADSAKFDVLKNEYFNKDQKIVIRFFSYFTKNICLIIT